MSVLHFVAYTASS